MIAKWGVENLKKIIVIAVMLLLLTGCQKQVVNKSSNQTIISEQEDQTFSNYQEHSSPSSSEYANELKTTTIDDTIQEDTSTIVLNYIEDLSAEVNELIEGGNLAKEAKDKIKKSFITITDFIFYGGKINDITFEELSLSAQEKVLKIYIAIDKNIESVWPNYKETIKSTSKKVYSTIIEDAIKLKDKIQAEYKEAIGEEAYNNSVQIFEEDLNRLKENTIPTVVRIKEKSKDVYQNIKEKANNWYQNFKESSD